MQNITEICFEIMHTNQYGENMTKWENINYSAQQCLPTYGKFYEGGIYNNGLKTHDPTSLQPWLSAQ
jgi:hypothetical protein